MDKYRISTGGDPRAFTEFGLLRDEISKLTHPARPDVDWQKVEQLIRTRFGIGHCDDTGFRCNK